MLILTSCAGTTGTSAIDPSVVACEGFKPISWSSRDTDQTIREAKAHNAAWTALCGAGTLATD